MDDWRNQIITTSCRYEEVLGYGYNNQVDRKQYPAGSVFFRRRKKRKFRTRYVVCHSNKWGILSVTNAEIRYRKSRRAWGIFIDDQPVAHYFTLKAAKLALSPGVLDRMGAEGDRCQDPPCSAPSSKTEA